MKAPHPLGAGCGAGFSVASDALGSRAGLTYSDAWHRLVTAGREVLPRHTGTGSLDERGNRVVDCDCWWRGNGLGWAGHLDSVVRSAIDR